MQTGLNSQIEMMNHFDSSSSSHDDFLKQMLSTLPSSSSWSLDPSNPNPLWNQPPPLYDQHNNLSAKFRNHHITDNNHLPLLLSSAAADSALLSIPRDFDSSPNDVVSAGDGSVQAIYNGLSGSLHGTAHASNQTQHFQPLPQGQGQSLGATNQAPNVQPKQRVRARRGQATDPHSIAERLRRERIAERMKALQELVPNANKTDKASMLDEIIDYVKFLQLQVKVLSMSRLGGAAAVAPLVADMSSEVAGDCNGNGGVHPRNLNGNQTSSSNDSLAMTERQVAKMMEEDMGSAMQYLQGKGLCLMPISLATAISTATCHTRNTLINHADGPSSPGRSALSVQSATAGNGGADSVVKDTASVSK